MRIHAVIICAALSILASCASSADHGERPLRAHDNASTRAEISHDVFFTFAEPNQEDIAGLIEACEALRAIPGVVYLTAGTRDPMQKRAVNDTSFHVALHVEFENQAAYDIYSPHEIHQALVTDFVPMMSAVVVYDALLP